MSARLSPKLRPGPWDALVVLAVVILGIATAVLMWGGGQDSGTLTVVITADGTEELRIPLIGSGPVIHTVLSGGYTLEVALSDGGVWVESSDCPTQDCVHTGHISRSGQSIVCLPARVIVTLEGAAGETDGPDIVIG